MDKKKLLIVTDTPVVTTGLGRICKELSSRFLINYDIAIAGWHHQPLKFQLPCHVYPLIKQNDQAISFAAILRDFNPDVFLGIGDIWDFFPLLGPYNEYKDSVKDLKSVLWVTIDGEWTSEWGDIIRSFDNVISFSKFGLQELKKYSKSEFEYVYPGIDAQTFYPYSFKPQWSEGYIDVDNTFICIIVAQNCDRKNIPGALDAFAEFALDKRNVYLLIATNPHDRWGHDIFNIVKINELGKKVAVVKGVNPFQGIKDAQLNLLYNIATVIINTSIGEGLGLPLLEAQAANCVPIGTNYAAITEIIGDRGKLIDVAEKVYGEYDIKRAIFSKQSLVNILNEMYEDWKNGKKLILQLNEKGREFAKDLTWDNTAKKIDDILQKSLSYSENKRIWIKEKVNIDTPLNILQVIPSWGKNCGIAEYTKELAEAIEERKKNISIFPGIDEKSLMNVVHRNNYNVVVFQHEYSFWQDRFYLQKILSQLKKMNVKTVIELHSFSPLTAYNEILLQEADEIIVHCDLFKDKLIKGREFNNIHVIPLACKPKIEINNSIIKNELGISRNSPIIGSFGFLRDQKGYNEILLAVKEFIPEYPNIKLLLVCPPHEFGSKNYNEKFFKYIEDIGMNDYTILIHEYMDEQKMLKVLSCVDIFVMNYKESPAGGGNSAALKTLLRVQKPIIVSDTFYFADMNSELLKVKNMNVNNIKSSIKSILINDEIAKGLVETANNYIEKNCWDRLIERHLEVYQ